METIPVTMGISDEEFREILSSMSGWYDRHGYINVLKLLYRDLVTEPDKLYTATKVIELFELLCTSGHLCSVDPTVLYDTINITQPFGLEPEIRKLTMKTLVNIRTVSISKCTRNRQMLFKVVKCLSDNDVKKITHLYNCPQETDRWELFVDMEKRRDFCEENLDDFMRKITTYLIRNVHKDPLALMMTGDMDVATREACPRTSRDDDQLELIVTDGTNVATREAGPSTSTDNVCMVNTTMVTQSNEGSIIGSQFVNCNFEKVIVNNTTEVPAAQGDRGASVIVVNDMIIRTYLQERQHILLSTSHLITPPTWNSEFEIDLTRMFTDLVILKINRKEKDRKKCTLQCLLDDVRSLDSCRVLIEGDGGIGKTTLLKHIAHRWATQPDNETFKEKLVFFINVRDIVEGEDVLDAVVKQINLKDFNRKTKSKLENKDAIQYFIFTHDDEMVLLLDGYDELEASIIDDDPIISIFNKIELKRSRVILTSRSGKLAEFLKSCDVHVTVEGFDITNSMDFIQKFFDFHNKKSSGKSLTKKLFGTFVVSEKEYEDYYSWVEMCKTPMLLLHICIMWRDKKCLPDDRADLFKELFQCILNQFTRNCDDEEKITEFADIPRKFETAMLLLGKCIYQNLKQNKLSIRKKELIGTKDDIELALKLGFVYEDSPVSELHFRKVYTTPHKLLSEALAGFYLCIASQQDDLNDEEWKEIRCNEYLHNTTVFAIGFLGENAGKFLKNWITNRETHLYHLGKYFRHVKTDHEDIVLKELDKSFNIHHLEMKTFTNLSKSLRRFIAFCSKHEHERNQKTYTIDYPRRFIAYCSKPEPCENDHFIKSIGEITNNRNIDEYYIHNWIQSVSNWETLKNQGRMVVHASIAFEDHSFVFEQNVLDLVSDITFIEGILSESKKLRFVFNMEVLDLSHTPVTNASFLSHMLLAPKLSCLILEDCNLTGALVKDVVDGLCTQCDRSVLSLTQLDLSNNNLSDVSGVTLAQLLGVAPTLHNIDLVECSLTGHIVGKFLIECDKMVIDVNGRVINFRGNNLSEMDAVKLLDVKSDPRIYSRHSGGARISPSEGPKSPTGGPGEGDKGPRCGFWAPFPRRNLSSFPDVGPGERNESLDCGPGGRQRPPVTVFGLFFPEEICQIYPTGGPTFPDGGPWSPGSPLLPPLSRHEFKWSDYHLSADNLQYVLQTCRESGSTFEFNILNLSDTDISAMDILVLTLIWKIFPKCKCVDMRKCSLSGTFVRALMNECRRDGVDLKGMICLEGNDLSDIDSTSLANYFLSCEVNNNYFCMRSFVWNSCYLSADNLQGLIDMYLGNGTTFQLRELSFNGTNLSTISGKTLALIWKVFPKLKYVAMNRCSLSGLIVGDMLIECDSNGVDLKRVTIYLQDNDLSDIDSTSLAHLCKTIPPIHDFLSPFNLSVDGIQDLLCAHFLKISRITNWRDYVKSAAKLQYLINECDRCGIELECSKVDLSRRDFDGVNGATLALLWKICPNLKHVSMSHCNLSCNVVVHFLKECDRNGIDLKCDMIDISWNNLSNIDSIYLCKLMSKGLITTYKYSCWNSYCLTAGDLEDLLQVCLTSGITFDVYKLDLSQTNLSTLSITTLVLVWQVFPKCKHVDMSKCSLTGRIVADLMNECKRNGVDFNINTICLTGNDLSDIDSASLINFMKVMKTTSDMFRPGFFAWDDYKLTSKNLEDLINLCHPDCPKMELRGLELIGVDLSAISGYSLAYVPKIFTKLIDLNMGKCKLSSRIVGDLVKECDKNDLKFGRINLRDNDLSDIDSTSVALLLKVSNTRLPLSTLDLSVNAIQNMVCAKFLKISGITDWPPYVESADKLHDLIDECVMSGITLECTDINLSGINLSKGNAAKLALLWKICPTLYRVDMRKCSLSGRIVGEILNKCKMDGVDLHGSKICVTENDLSDINSSSLAHFVRINMPSRNNNCYHSDFKLEDYNLSVNGIQHLICPRFLKISGITRWCDYFNSADKLQDLIVECDRCSIELECSEVHLDGMDLDDVNRNTLALLWKICPKLNQVSMINCSLSGNIVREFLNECDRNDIDLKSKLICLQDNDLSDIDSTSLARLLRILCNNMTCSYFPFTHYNLSLDGIQVLLNAEFLKISGITEWSKYVLSADKLHDLIDECFSCGIELVCIKLNLSGMDLAKANVKLLALLWKICPNLDHVNMSRCNLSGIIVRDLMNACLQNGVSLKYYMICLDWNDLSDFESSSFAYFIKMFHNPHISFHEYSLSIDGIQHLICAEFLKISNITDWSVYVKSVNKLHDLIDECHKNGTELQCSSVNLSKMDLSEVNVIKLALLWKICPKLNHVNMSNCSLSVTIVRDLLIQCENNGVNLQPCTLCLCKNVLHGIDDPTLFKLMKTGTLNKIEFNNQPNSSCCTWYDYALSVDNLQGLLQTCYERGTKLDLDELDISGTDLSEISVSVLALIWLVIPNCHVDMQSCNLSGKMVGELLNECERNGVNLIGDMICLRYNNLSDIDSTSLSHFIKLNSMNFNKEDWNNFRLEDYKLSVDVIQATISADFLKVTKITQWRYYVKSADKLQDLINECDGCGTELECSEVHLDGMDLAEVNGETLALLWKICPKLNQVNVNVCKLSGMIIRDLLTKLNMLGVELKGDMISLYSNDLSDIDATSLAQLTQVSGFQWNDCRLSVKNLTDLTNAYYGGNDTLKCTEMNVSWVDLSTFSGEMLVNLCKISPKLKNLRIDNCKLPSTIVHDFVSLCLEKKMVVALTKLDLSDNDLHDLTGKTLSVLFTIFNQLRTLILNRCNMICKAVCHFLRSCLIGNVNLTLTELDLSNNDLDDFNGESLAALFSIFPQLDCLKIEQCKLSSTAVCDFVSLCLKDNKVLPLAKIVLSHNDLHSLTGESLGSVFSIFHQLDCIKMEWCELPDTILHDFVRSCLKDNVVFPLTKLVLTSERSHVISGKSLASLFYILPNLKEINIGYQLSDRTLLSMADAIHDSIPQLQKMHITTFNYDNTIERLKAIFPNCVFGIIW